MDNLKSVIFSLASDILRHSEKNTKTVFQLIEKLVLAGFKLDYCLSCAVSDNNSAKKSAFLQALEEVGMAKYAEQLLHQGKYPLECGPTLLSQLVVLYSSIVANEATKGGD